MLSEGSQLAPLYDGDCRSRLYAGLCILDDAAYVAREPFVARVPESAVPPCDAEAPSECVEQVWLLLRATSSGKPCACDFWKLCSARQSHTVDGVAEGTSSVSSHEALAVPTPALAAPGLPVSASRAPSVARAPSASWRPLPSPPCPPAPRPHLRTATATSRPRGSSRPLPGRPVPPPPRRPPPPLAPCTRPRARARRARHRRSCRTAARPTRGTRSSRRARRSSSGTRACGSSTRSSTSSPCRGLRGTLGGSGPTGVRPCARESGPCTASLTSAGSAY